MTDAQSAMLIADAGTHEIVRLREENRRLRNEVKQFLHVWDQWRAASTASPFMTPEVEALRAAFADGEGGKASEWRRNFKAALDLNTRRLEEILAHLKEDAEDARRTNTATRSAAAYARYSEIAGRQDA